VVALIAGVIFTVSAHDDDNHQHSIWCAFEITMQIIVVLVATIYFRKRIAVMHDHSVVMPLLLMVVLLSLLCEPIQRLFFDSGHSFEILVMHSQCNLMLALAVCGFRQSFQRLCVLIAVFLTIFCCTISSRPILIPLVAVFVVSTLAWLVASWWETVDRRVQGSGKRSPLRFWSVGTVVLPAALLLAVTGPTTDIATTALNGFMPGSGGTGSYDPFSRGGVKDGDALVAGNENIKSFAPLEDAPFLDSDKPSLYDVFNDIFDTPPREIREQQRTIPLPAELLKHVHQKMAEARQAGREFTLLRNERRADRSRIHDLQSHALFYVAGRTPLHLRMEVYDVFDGMTWYPMADEEQRANVRMATIDERPWLQLPRTGKGFDLYSGTETHSIKIANLDGNVVPSPVRMFGVHIDHLDRQDLYHVSNSGIVSLNRDSIPPLTPISVVSDCVDRDALVASDRVSLIRRTFDPAVALPTGVHFDQIQRLAETWTRDVPRGWQQVDAIAGTLRSRCTLDRQTKVSDDCVSPVSEFLFEMKRGPEYMFASSAAVMLRSLGYPTRLVSGFYARPENYDGRKKHTSVHASDAHFWCEVLIGADTWITVEPSPGYEVLSPRPGILQRLRNALQVSRQLLTRHALEIGLLAVCCLTAFVRRRFLQDLLFTLHWNLTRSRALHRERVLQLVRLIDRRLALAGMTRQQSRTLRRWSRYECPDLLQPDLRRVAELADWAAFSDAATKAPRLEFDLDELDELARRLRTRILRQLRPSSSAGKPQAG
jgi:hypothetical protein